ncbi:hypothetical protein LTR27_004284 [Elasticomyces elasticus]|nr:hypothetical protein LTR27_004284 [Elasticomyces elasticus]
MATPFFDKLAAETRLQIYAEVLRSSGSVEHFQSIIRDKDTRGVVRRLRGVHTAILRVNRQAHNEALPVFYECNTIIIRHVYVCLTEPGRLAKFSHCDNQLLRKVLVKDPSNVNFDPLSRCCDKIAPAYLNEVANTARLSCPKLQVITIPLPYFRPYPNSLLPLDGIEETLGEGLRRHGFDVKCVKVGELNLKSPSSTTSFILQDDVLATAWKKYSQANLNDLAQAVPAGPRDSLVLTELVRDLFLAKEGSLDSFRRQPLIKMLDDGIEFKREWLELRNQHGRTLELTAHGIDLTMAIFTDLATETRFQIFEYLLQFPHPLKLVPYTKPKGNKRRPKRLFGRINATAVLFLSHKIHIEAITVFYNLNIIRIEHEDICLRELHCLPLNCERDLLVHAVLDDSSICSPFSSCDCGEHLNGIVRTLTTSEWFPRLKDITINVKGDNSVSELRRQLREPREHDCELDTDTTHDSDEHAKALQHDLQAYLDEWEGDSVYLLNCIAVGRFQVVSEYHEDDLPTVIFQYRDIARTWDYYAALPEDHPELEHDADHQHLAALTAVRCGLVGVVHSFFAARVAYLAHAKVCEHFHNYSAGFKFGNQEFSMADLEGKKLDAEGCEKVAAFLMPAATGQRYFDWFN